MMPAALTQPAQRYALRSLERRVGATQTCERFPDSERTQALVRHFQSANSDE
jgi:hypothetical protein